jgi:hypothetical protein
VDLHVLGSSAPLRKLGDAYSGSSSSKPNVLVPPPPGYTEAHTAHAHDLKHYQTRVYATHGGHFGTVQGRLVVWEPGRVKPTMLVVCIVLSFSISGKTEPSIG